MFAPRTLTALLVVAGLLLGVGTPARAGLGDRLRQIARSWKPGPPTKVQQRRQLQSLHRLKDRASYDRALSHAWRTLRKELRSGRGRTPGIILLDKQLPTVVISDLHGRRDYLASVLMERDSATGSSYLSLLKRGKVQIVLVGDGMHGEHRARARWERADADADSGRFFGRAIETEVAESLNTMKLVMGLKARYPKHFHYLKGNHDNIRNSDLGGDHSFYKYAISNGEGQLVKRFLSARFGTRFVDRWAAFERRLPLLAVGEGFAVSHSGPGEVLPRSEIEGRSARAVEAFTWTDLTGNDRRQARIARDQLAALGVPGGIYFAGHRHTGDARVRIQGPLYQFNGEAPHQFFAVLRPGTPFDPKPDLKDAAPRRRRPRPLETAP